MIIEETGGTHGVRELEVIEGLTLSPKQSVFNQDLYPTLYDKAAVYAREIMMRHAFVDGNKRSGMTAAFVFLENNGYVATAKQGEIEKFALRIVLEHLDIPEITKWLKSKSRKHHRVK